MLPNYDDFVIRRFDHPDEVRTFEKGKFETVKIGSMLIGRASYEPGWKWSEHVGAAIGAALCEVEHVGMVVSGCAACRMKDGRYYEMKPGDLFYIEPGHDSWVVGGEPYVSLHFLGAGHYARPSQARHRIPGFSPLHADVDSTSMTIEQDSSDFRAGAGVKFAFALIETDLKNGEVVETAVVKSIKINPPPASFNLREGLEAVIKNL